ncbi:MAG TPA: response regulator transcription factor [Firmicutes bacterium]|nr:response regulator transcription factor [Bacillota bacterium]
MDRILVIDDEPNIRLMLSLALNEAGYEVSCAADGQEAWQKMERGFHPTLILVDLNMPRLSGKDFIIKMRGSQKYAQVPVIILTGSMPESDHLPPPAMYQQLVSKPFDLDELIVLAKSFCGLPWAAGTAPYDTRRT